MVGCVIAAGTLALVDEFRADGFTGSGDISGAGIRAGIGETWLAASDAEDEIERGAGPGTGGYALISERLLLGIDIRGCCRQD